MSLGELFNRREQPLTILDRTVKAPSVKVNAPSAVKPEPLPPLHRFSKASEIAARAVFIRPGEYRCQIPNGWVGSMEDIHEELALRTSLMLMSGSFPTIAKRDMPKAEPLVAPPALTPEQTWFQKQVNALKLNRWTWPRLKTRRT